MGDVPTSWEHSFEGVTVVGHETTQGVALQGHNGVLTSGKSDDHPRKGASHIVLDSHDHTHKAVEVLLVSVEPTHEITAHSCSSMSTTQTPS